VVTPAASDPEVSIVWYHRARDDEPWKVVVTPSWTTMAPGQHTGRPIRTDHLLPSGNYRADLVVDGRVAESVSARYDPPAGYERVVIPELGFSAVIPDTWERSDSPYGIETVLASPESPGSLVLRREEVVHADIDMDEWLRATLDGWVAQVAGTEIGEGTDLANPWSFGADHRVETVYPEAGAWAAIGFSPYLEDHPACGGTAFMTMVSGVDAETTELVSLSLLLNDGAEFEMPTVDAPAASAGFALDVPEGWAGVERPAGGAGAVFTARDCDTGASVAVDTEDASGMLLDDYVDIGVDVYEAEGIRFDARRSTQLRSGEPAVELDYSVVGDGVEATQRQLLAIDGSTAYVVTITTDPGLDDDREDIADQVVDSFEITAT
jgi:hypothetical protein